MTLHWNNRSLACVCVSIKNNFYWFLSNNFIIVNTLKSKIKLIKCFLFILKLFNLSELYEIWRKIQKNNEFKDIENKKSMLFVWNIDSEKLSKV